MKNSFNRTGRLLANLRSIGKGERSQRVRRYLWLIMPASALVILLTVFLQDLVHQVILLPIAYVFWLGGKFLTSTPDILLWIWLILMVTILALRSLSTGRDRKAHPVEPVLYRSRRDRQAFWMLQIQMAESVYARMRLVDFLGKVTSRVLSYRERIPADQIEENLINGDLVIPPEVASFINQKTRPGASYPRQLWMGVRMSLGRLFNNLTGKGKSDTFERDLIRLVEFLEKQLDIKPGDPVIPGTGSLVSSVLTQNQLDKK